MCNKTETTGLASADLRTLSHSLGHWNRTRKEEVIGANRHGWYEKSNLHVRPVSNIFGSTEQLAGQLTVWKIGQTEKQE